MKPISRARCRTCGRDRSPDLPISRRGFCPDCGARAAAQAAQNMTDHAGPYFDRWRERTAAAVGARVKPASHAPPPGHPPDKS